eukprot:Amastigsp_a186350_5.p3 type:complete len:106 gc:universal Amastigsp_a186350_5:591-908(+)
MLRRKLPLQEKAARTAPKHCLRGLRILLKTRRAMRGEEPRSQVGPSSPSCLGAEQPCGPGTEERAAPRCRSRSSLQRARILRFRLPGAQTEATIRRRREMTPRIR